MTGKKGRSGRISTPEQAQRRAMAAGKGGVARWMKARKSEGAEPARTDEARTPIPPLTPEQEAALSRVAANLPPPLTWREALQRQQTGVAALKGEILAIELETKRRERIPIEEARAYVEALNALIKREVATVLGLAETIPEARAHQVEAMRAALVAWVDTFTRSLPGIEP